MSAFPKHLNNFLWGDNLDFYKAGVGASCISFFKMQVIRFILIIVLLIVWALNFYVNVKKAALYLNFWALTFTLIYMLTVFPSAGRQVIEKELTRKKQLLIEE